MTNASTNAIIDIVASNLANPLSFSSILNFVLLFLLGLAAAILAVVLFTIALSLVISFVLSLFTFVPKMLVRKPKSGIVDLLRTTWQNAFLMLREVVSQRLISIIVFLSIVVAAYCFAAFDIIGTNFNNYINNKFATSIPPNTIKVTPKPAPSLGILGLTLRRPEGSVLNDTYLEKIVRLPGVKQIHPFMAVQIPVQALIGIFGIRYRTDLVCIGAPYNMVAPDIMNNDFRKMWRDWAPGRDMPVMIPRDLLEAYNSSMAEPNGLPKITESLVMGLKAELLLGKSSLKEIPGYEVAQATMVGFTRNVPSLAVVVPLEVARYYNKKFKGGTSDKEYVYSFVTVEDHASLLSVAAKIKSWGFVVEAEKSLSEEIISLKQLVQSLVGVMSAIILFLAAIAIAFSTTIATFNRMDYYRILRILGSSKFFLTMTVLLKYAIIGFIASFTAFKLVEWSGQVLSQAIASFLAQFQVQDFHIELTADKALRTKILMLGTLIPMISTLPSLIQLQVKALNRD